MQYKMLAMIIDRIVRINGLDQKAPATTQWDPEMVIADEDV
jgi:hypothetical protein